MKGSPPDIALTIVTGMTGNKDEAENDLEVMADEILKAIKDDDKADLAEALKAFIYLCDSDDDSEESDDSEKEETRKTMRRDYED